MGVLILFIFSFLLYLFLTIGSGKIVSWSLEEIIAGILFAIFVAFLAKKLFSIVRVKVSFKFLNPVRWLLFFIYVIGPFFFSMTKANLDVAYRVITGKIRPGIVKIPSRLKTDLGITLLANSITLTPGTLSVDIDKENNIYVHWIYVRHKKPKTEEICSNFPRWIRRITE